MGLPGDPVRHRALVTGASSGIGMAFAERLASDHHDLVVVARRRERLEALAQRLQDRHGVSVQVLAADLTSTDGLHAVEALIADDPSLEIVVNNAGAAGYMPFVALAPERAEALIGLHVVAVTRLTRAALPGMLDRGRGTIINVASALAFSAGTPSSRPLPKRAVYGACKAYLVAFTRLLADEVAGSGVRLQVLCPGYVEHTELHDGLPDLNLAARRPAALQPVEVVAASLAGTRLGEIVCVPGLAEADLVDRLHEGEQCLFVGAASGRLAPRYVDPA